MTVHEIALDISEGLARAACAGEVDGETVDLRTVVDKDCALNILTFDMTRAERAAYRHTVRPTLWRRRSNACTRMTKAGHRPVCGRGISTTTWTGIAPLTGDDLEKIEAEMKKIVKEALPLDQVHASQGGGHCLFMEEKEEPYKVELIRGSAGETR